MTKDPVDRRLAAMLSADLAGEARPAAEAASAGARAADREQLRLAVERCGGRLLDAPDEGVLAAFASSEEAVACALEIRSALAARGRDGDVRIGVHAAEGSEGEGGVSGEGGHAAVRLRELAGDGGICVSAAVREQLGTALDVSYEDLGPHALEGAAASASAFRVAARTHRSAPVSLQRVGLLLFASLVVPALVGVAWVVYFTRGEPTPAPAEAALTAIAVLPFAGPGPGGGQEAAGDALASELIEALSRLEALRVSGQGPAFALRGADAREVARALGVAAVVEGSVGGSNDGLEVTARLVRASDGQPLWSGRFERKRGGAAAPEPELAREIAAAVAAELGVAPDGLRGAPTER